MNYKNIFTFLFFFSCSIYLVSPLFPESIIEAPDSHTHTRHIYEYSEALKGGQFPPLVAPDMNFKTRIPLFQYYSGTSYALAALSTFFGLDPYQGLKFSVVLLSLISMSLLFKLFNRNFGCWPSLLAALVFQFNPFLMRDLIGRFSYPEWVSSQFAILALWGLISLSEYTHQGNSFKTLKYFLLSVAGMALFIPSHPIQTLYCGLVIGLIVIFYNLFRLKTIKGLKFACGAFATSLMLTAWFWVPILRDRAELKITGHVGFFSRCSNLSDLFLPWFGQCYSGGAFDYFANQLGFLTLISLLTLFYRWKRINTFSYFTLVALKILLILVLAPAYINGLSLWLQSTYQWLLPGLAPMQWSYRLLVPAAVLQSFVVAEAMQFIFALFERIPRFKPWLGTCIVFGILISNYFYLYFDQTQYRKNSIDVLSENFFDYNPSTYSFLGTDFSRLDFVSKRTDSVTIFPEGQFFDIFLIFKNQEVPPFVWIDLQQVTAQYEKMSDGSLKVRFSVSPSVGIGSTFRSLRLSRQDASKITEIYFQVRGDSFTTHLPGSARWVDQSNLEVKVDKEAIYQLPFNFFPSQKVFVNGEFAKHQSQDKHMFITSLSRGVNRVTIVDSMSDANKILGFLGIAVVIWVGILLVLEKKRK